MTTARFEVVFTATAEVTPAAPTSPDDAPGTDEGEAQ